MAVFSIEILIFFTISRCLKADTIEMHPDIYLDTTETINKYGYPVETHEVTTEDGYILKMFRIPHGKNQSGINKKPIFLMHGLFGQCEYFTIAGIYNSSLAYHLADRDYDVWLGNTRGTYHCRTHKTLNATQKEFWNFSWHEIGIYDLPASIDYILSNTGQSRIFYVGYSQGGTSFYIMTSLKPEYQKKIALASLLAPAGYFNHFTNPVLLPFIKNIKALEALAKSIVELPPSIIPLGPIIASICEMKPFRKICLQVFQLVAGPYSSEFPKYMVALFGKYTPSVAFMQTLHYGQSIDSGHFRPWDYGKKRNLKLYGSEEPADYPIKKINVPIAIYHGLSDNLVYPKDIDQISKDLPNCVRKHLVPHPKFNHFDFTFSMNNDQVLDPLIHFLEKYDL